MKTKIRHQLSESGSDSEQTIAIAHHLRCYTVDALSLRYWLLGNTVRYCVTDSWQSGSYTIYVVLLVRQIFLSLSSRSKMLFFVVVVFLFVFFLFLFFYEQY